MERKDINRKTGALTKELSAFLQDELEKRGKTAQDIAKALNRSYTYAYVRVQGTKSFTLDELEIVAHILGVKTVYELIAAVREYTYAQLKDAYTEFVPTITAENLPKSIYAEVLDLAASEDSNKQTEREYDDFGA